MTRLSAIPNASPIKAFQEIKMESRERIIHIANKRILKKGEILFLEKDKIEHFYAVISGKVSMYRLNSEGQKRVFFLLGKGNLLNEVVFDDLPVSVVCEAFEKAEILELGKVEFLSIMEQDFKLTMQILNSIGRKQRRLYRQLKNTLPIGMEKKLAAKLWKLAKDYGVDVEKPQTELIEKSQTETDKVPTKASGEEQWKHIDMNISCTYLSYMLGTSRESISRSMKILQNLDACKWVDRQLYVKENQLLSYYRSK